MTVVEMAMRQRAQDRTLLFGTIESGRAGQCNFLCLGLMRAEAEE